MRIELKWSTVLIFEAMCCCFVPPSCFSFFLCVH